MTRQFTSGLLIISVILIVAIFPHNIAPYSYDAIDIEHRYEPPSIRHFFGTDEFGRDVFSRVIMGSRSSLFMGFGATFLCTILGVPLGLIAGYFKGRIDELIMRSMDIIMSFPPIVLGMLILAFTTPNLYKAVIAVGIVYIPSMARVTRSVVLSLGEQEFVLSAKTAGESSFQIIFREILPNVWPVIIVEASLRITFAILLGAALSFIGIGAQPPSSDWGLMISEARAYIYDAPWIVICPGIVMCMLVLGVSLFGDGLRELLDPRLSKVRR